MLTDRLKNINADAITMEEAVELFAGAKGMLDTYASLQVDAPDFLESAMKALKREIRNRNHDNLSQKLSAAKRSRESLKPAEEKRKELDTQIEALEKQLAVE